MNDSADAPASAARPVRIRRLKLSNFRSYEAASLETEASTVALTGDNGAGKTNLLEALSLFSPGRGMRRAEFVDCARRDGPGGWAASIEIAGAAGATRLGTGLEPESEAGSRGRRNRIDRAAVASSGAFCDHLRLIWLTPEMDLLFAAPPAERRRFLDRLTLTIDPAHGARVSALERAMRSRNRLLEDADPNRNWLDAVEREIAELGVAVAAARVDAAARLSTSIAAARSRSGAFPWADVALVGELEEQTRFAPAIEIEERHRAVLRDNRRRDAAARRTGAGLRSADLLVRHGPKQTEAAQCSTGEQKALLVGLVLAHAGLVADACGLAPIMLLDELAAHFDPSRRAALYADLRALGSQIWMTGADPAAFCGLDAGADIFLVSPGKASIKRRDA